MSPNITTNRKTAPTILIIFDGFGYRAEKAGNAIKLATVPFWEHLWNAYPHTLLKASGPDVGLLPGFAGNSEVGHRALGTGRVVDTVLKKFHESIADGSFYKNSMLNDSFEKLKTSNGALHLIGLVSDAGVHSHQEHLYALIKLAQQKGLKNVFIHAFLDGRDSLPTSARKYLDDLQRFCLQLNCGIIASIQGRFFAMDRDNNWERTAQAYYALCNIDPLTGEKKTVTAKNWSSELEDYYKNGITDEFIPPTLLVEQGAIKEGDGIVFFNFRPDRARQLSESFLNPNFTKFRKNNLTVKQQTLAFFISTALYKDEFSTWGNQALFNREVVDHTLLDEIASQARQHHANTIFSIAETEKYAHISYFFRGEKETVLPGQTQIVVPSIKTRNYIGHPEMSAPQITAILLKSLKQNPAYFYLANYANADMVGHSGNLTAAIKAIECLNKQLEILYETVVKQMGGTIFIVADHGNAEEMIDVTTGKPKTSHTRSPVPFMVITPENQIASLAGPEQLGLANVAPTILKYLGLNIPQEMLQQTIF